VLSGSTPELKETSLWYLPMGDHEAWLRDYLERGELDGKHHHEVKEWKKHVLGQCKSWIDGGLQSRAMTRDLDWGVPVPLPGAEGKVLYVWLDAPIGYITATKNWAVQHGKDWEAYWKSEDTELIHFIGKDNIVFHCLIFPILLKAHGGYNLPYNVPANEFMNLEGDKISTSRNWAVWLHEYLEEFPGKQDELRYVLCSIMPEQKDSEFTWGDYKDRVNNELADILGNFINRVTVLTHKYFEGVVPSAGALSERDEEVLQSIGVLADSVGSNIRAFRFREALAEAMNLARLGNKYMTDEEPWKVWKTDQERVKTILHVCAQVAANCAVVLHPFLPFTAEKLGVVFGVNPLQWNAHRSLVAAGSTLGQPEILFAKVDDALVDRQIQKLVQAKKAAVVKEVAPMKPLVSFEDFSAMDIRIGEIIEAERVPKTKKLLKLRVRTGVDERTVVSGIAESYEPEQAVGRKVAMLINLAPREIKGIVSEGMILMAEDDDGGLSFVTPEKGNVGAGSEVK
jgi:methionyl-tRNA synthetase